MYVVHVYVQVKDDFIDEFKNLTIENAKNSILEPGIARFDVIQQQDDPSKFVLNEVYHSVEDTAKHKLTGHYKEWRDGVADMMKEPRSSIKYFNVYPENKGWE